MATMRGHTMRWAPDTQSQALITDLTFRNLEGEVIDVRSSWRWFDCGDSLYVALMATTQSSGRLVFTPAHAETASPGEPKILQPYQNLQEQNIVSGTTFTWIKMDADLPTISSVTKIWKEREAERSAGVGATVPEEVRWEEEDEIENLKDGFGVLRLLSALLRGQ